MKRILSVSLGSARDDYSFEAQVLGQQVQLSRVGTNGDWQRAVELVRRSDGQVAAIGVAGIRLYRQQGARRRPLRGRRAMAIREAVHVSRLADGQRVRPILARRAVAALEAHLNKSGGGLEGRQALLPIVVETLDLAENLRTFGCSIVAGDLLSTLGFRVPLRNLRALRAASPLLRCLAGWRARRQNDVPALAARWQTMVEQAHVLAVPRPESLAALGLAAAGKIIVAETASEEAVAVLQRKGAILVVSAGPEVGGRCLEPDTVEALLLALSEKPEAEIEVGDLEAAAARIPLRPAVYGPW